MIGYASELRVNCSCVWPSKALHPCIVMVTKQDRQPASHWRWCWDYVQRTWCCSDSLQHGNRRHIILVIVPGMDYSLMRGVLCISLHYSFRLPTLLLDLFFRKRRVELYAGPMNLLVHTFVKVSVEIYLTRHPPPSVWPKSVRKKPFIPFFKQSCLCGF